MSSSVFDLILKGTYHGAPVPQGKPYRAAAHGRKGAKDAKHDIDNTVKLGIYPVKLFIHVFAELLLFLLEERPALLRAV